MEYRHLEDRVAIVRRASPGPHAPVLILSMQLMLRPTARFNSADLLLMNSSVFFILEALKHRLKKRFSLSNEKTFEQNRTISFAFFEP